MWLQLLVIICGVAAATARDPWESLYTIHTDPSTKTLHNIAWLWMHIGGGDTAAVPEFDPNDMIWPTTSAEWDLAGRTLESLCLSNPTAALCGELCRESAQQRSRGGGLMGGVCR